MPRGTASSVTAIEPKQDKMFPLLAIYCTLHKNIILIKGVHVPKISYHTSRRKLPLGKNALVFLFSSLHRAFCSLIAHTNTRAHTHTHTHTYIYIYICYLRSLKFKLKHLKLSYMFRTHDHLRRAFTVRC